MPFRHLLDVRISIGIAAVVLFTSVSLFGGSLPAEAASTFSPITKGDIIASLANGQVNEYSPSGTFVQTLIPNASTPTGSAFDGAGNLYVTEFGANDILKVDATTGAVSVFSSDSTLGDGTSFDSPESIAFGPGYTKMYVSDANRDGANGGIHVIDMATGKGSGFFPLPSSSGSEGVGESDWLAFDHSGSLFMTNENPTQGIMQVDTKAGDIVQPSFVANLPNYGYALSFDSNGNIWLSDTSSILEYDPSGKLINTITNPNFQTVFSAVFNPPYNTVYAGDLSSGNIYTYDLKGNLLNTFNVGSGVDGLSVAGTVVVPGPPPIATHDVVVNNVDSSLANTQGSGNEPTIAINPTNPQQIVVAAAEEDSSDRWGAGHPNAPIWVSNDGGNTWQKSYSVPAPPHRFLTGCPCDTTINYSRNGTLYLSVLSQEGDILKLLHPGGQDVYTASNSGDPTKSGDWHWRLRNFIAQATNSSAYKKNADQPWLVTGPAPDRMSTDNVYVGYDNMVNSPDTQARVAASLHDAAPPDFTQESSPGPYSRSSIGITNPGLRLATDPKTGSLYALWAIGHPGTAPDVPSVTYHLNRSTDGGRTWGLNGHANGIIVTTTPSYQGGNAEFGNVDELLGSVDHLAVDPSNSDVYVTYGGDAVSGEGSKIYVQRFTPSNGGLNPGSPVAVSGTAPSALPSIAVRADGMVGLLYTSIIEETTVDSTVTTEFAVNLATSKDHGAIWQQEQIATYQLTSADCSSNCPPPPRLLGDYAQLKAMGNVFYGVFAAARTAFDPNTAADDNTVDPVVFSDGS
jgi:hypothetical protein